MHLKCIENLKKIFVLPWNNFYEYFLWKKRKNGLFFFLFPETLIFWSLALSCKYGSFKSCFLIGKEKNSLLANFPNAPKVLFSKYNFLPTLALALLIFFRKKVIFFKVLDLSEPLLKRCNVGSMKSFVKKNLFSFENIYHFFKFKYFESLGSGLS